MRIALVTVCSIALAAGCARAHSTGEVPGSDDPGSSTSPVPGTPTPTTPIPLAVTPTYSGIYTANALLDFTQPGVLPGLESPALAALAELDTNPGDALVGFAQAAGAIDLDSTALTIISFVITQQLKNVIPPDVQKALGVIAGITKIAKTTTLMNTMTVHTPSQDGTVQVDIAVNGAAFDFVDVHGNPQHVVVSTSAANLATSRTTVTATLQPHVNAPIADADLAFEAGSLDLPIGALIDQAMGPLVFQPEWGTTTLTQTLTQLMSDPCKALGVAVETGVADLLDIDIGAQVGTTICTIAVDLAAAELTAELDKLELHGVRITNGRATLFDVSPAIPIVDYESDLLGNGSWTWTLGSVTVPSAILDGNRVGDSY